MLKFCSGALRFVFCACKMLITHTFTCNYTYIPTCNDADYTNICTNTHFFFCVFYLMAVALNTHTYTHTNTHTHTHTHTQDLQLIHVGFFSDLSKAAQSRHGSIHSPGHMTMSDCFIKWKERCSGCLVVFLCLVVWLFFCFCVCFFV